MRATLIILLLLQSLYVVIPLVNASLYVWMWLVLGVVLPASTGALLGLALDAIKQPKVTA